MHGTEAESGRGHDGSSGAREEDGGSVAKVRAILWRHLVSQCPQAPASPESDANRLVPAADFAHALAAAVPTAPEQRRLGRDYASLWGRTFRQLVRHLEGRPDDLLRILAGEVFPYLYGDPLAARLEGRRRIRVRPGLPVPYVQGLLEGFLKLSRCQADAHHEGHGAWRLHVRVEPAARIVYATHLARTLRIPYLATAMAAVLVGIATTWPGADVWRAVAVVVGVFSAQAAANAIPDVLRRPSPLEALPPRPWLHAQVIGSSSVAAAAGAWLIFPEPHLIAYAAAGGALVALYSRLRRLGLGPMVTAFAHGPLLTTAAADAVAGPGADLALAAYAGIPIGLAAAALLYLGDLADRPVDEARGERTLAVRLPRPRQVVAFALPLALALATILPLLLAPLWHSGFGLQDAGAGTGLEPADGGSSGSLAGSGPGSVPWPAAVAAVGTVLALLAVVTVTIVRVVRNAEDPRRLASARVAASLVHTALAVATALAVLGIPYGALA